MFTNLSPLQLDPVFQMWNDFLEDPHTNKQNLGIGIYSDKKGTPYVMPSIQEAAKSIPTDNFNYVSMSGNPSFLHSTGSLVLGDCFQAEKTALQQTCGGTQALKIYADIAKKDGYKTVLFSDPTWINHHALFNKFDHKKTQHLTKTNDINLSAYKDALTNLDNKSILMLQGGPTHNPCGINLSIKHLESLLPIIKEKKIAVCIDVAYLGFGDSIEEDRTMIQYLWKNLSDIAIAVSFSKNGCLYRQRTGALLIKTNNKKLVDSHLQIAIRESISNPPAFGAEVINECLNNKFDQWKEDLTFMRESINRRRSALIKLLPANYQYLSKTKGMFGILPLKDEDIQTLRHIYGIYITDDKRINFAGIQEDHIEYLAKALQSISK